MRRISEVAELHIGAHAVGATLRAALTIARATRSVLPALDQIAAHRRREPEGDPARQPLAADTRPDDAADETAATQTDAPGILSEADSALLRRRIAAVRVDAHPRAALRIVLLRLAAVGWIVGAAGP
jgi:hypothetical protein